MFHMNDSPELKKLTFAWKKISIILPDESVEIIHCSGVTLLWKIMNFMRKQFISFFYKNLSA